jgi:predicted ABC-type ATPase
LFIAGQPGAGKTTMQAAAMERLGLKDAYVLDHDELLDQHPDYASSAFENDYTAAGKHSEDVSAWRGWALHDVQDLQMDVVVPYPIFGQGDLDLVKQFQEKGYRVEVAFAAVHEAQSQLGIMERFNDGRQEVGYGRWIDAYVHDGISRDMLPAADAIEAQGLADAVHVYRRGEAEPIFTNERKNGVWSHQPGSSRWAIETERNRPWTDREVGHFVRGWNKLSALARRPLKDHFKAMPLMASDEGRRLLGKLQEMAAPKIAEHQRLAEVRVAGERARAAGPAPQQQSPPAPQQQSPPAPQQQSPPAPQQSPPAPQRPDGPPVDRQSGQDWQEFGVRLQTEQASPHNISAPGAESPSQPAGGAVPPAHRTHRNQAAGGSREERGAGGTD